MSQALAQSRPAGGSRLAQGVVVGVAALTPVLAYLNSIGFAFVVALAGILSLPLMIKTRPPIVGFAFLVALAAWAVVSMQWSSYLQAIDLTTTSIEDLTGAKMLLELGLYGAFVVAAAGLGRREAQRASLVLALGVLALAVLFLVEGVGKAGIYHWIRGVAGQPTDPGFAIRDVGRVAFVLVLLFWPAAVRLAGVRIGQASLWPSVLFIAGASAVGAWLLGADAPIAALAVSGVVFGAVYWGGRRAVWAGLVATIVYFAVAPLLLQMALPAMSRLFGPGSGHESWAIRLDIWRFAVARILEQPFFGWGLDASRSFSPQIQLHPHNGALQLWLELGAVGVALAATFWAWLFIRIARIAETDRTMAAAATATASVYLTIGSLSFGIWQEWWLALGALAAVACIVGTRARSAPQGVEPGVDEAGLAA